jgi:hypothetical protein
MKTLTIYLNSLFNGAVKAVIFILSLYISVIFFLIILFEQTLFGKTNQQRQASMHEFMQKLSNIAEPKEVQSEVKTNNSLS